MPNIFVEFIEVRKKLKAVNSDRAIKMLIKKLEPYDDDTKYEMIENSIIHSWKDVYELKEYNNQQNKSKEIKPEWFDKDVKKQSSEETEKELKELLREFK